MVWMTIYSLGNLFRIYLLRKYIQIFLEEEMPEKVSIKEMLAYGLFFFVNTGTSIAFQLVWLNITVNIIGISLLILLYTSSIWTNLFLTSSIYLIHMACDTVSCFLIENGRNGGNRADWHVRMVSAVTTAILIFICELVMEKVVNYRKNPGIVQSLPLIFVPVCSIATVWIVITVLDIGDGWMVIVMVSLGMLFINFFVLYLYNMLLRAFSEKYENDMLKQKIAVYANQMDMILQNEERVQRLRHDMKHHMNELKLLAIKNEDAMIQEYINSMEEFIQSPQEIISSGNTEIDSVLNYMLQKAREELRTVGVKVQLPETVRHSFDINVILGNLLENAIEAARGTEEKLLNVKINLKQGILRIEIENSFCRELLQERDSRGNHAWGNGPFRRDSFFRTTKADKKEHGIGLISVKRIVEKYNGMMEAYPNGKRFCIKLILYMHS